jgi:Conjugal transfer protein
MIWVALATILAAGAASARPARRGALAKDILRFPYAEGAVYRVTLVPGSPFVVELPSGESARSIWRDTQYWMAETTEGSTRVVIRAIASSDILGRRGFIHIETSPSQLRITLRVQAVDERREVPAALQIYLDRATSSDAIGRQVRQRVDAELVLVRKHAVEEERARFEAWKRQTLSSLRDDYEWGGDFRILRVVDNRLQTYITVPDGNDKAVIQYIDRAGKAEIVNFEFSNGVYVLENKVLRKGEKFRLILGKEKAWVALK